MKRQLPPIRVLAAVLLLLGGCAPSVPVSPPVMLSSESWSFDGLPARRIRSPHYLLHTTLADERQARRIARFMEQALGEYRALAGDIDLSGGRPMSVYLFATRRQWARFTAECTGDDARVYLQIVRGGYTARDVSVMYDMGERPTYSVLAHEGWHQFVGRHFKGRLPPFLEEGLACAFEEFRGGDESPAWNLSSNPNRLGRLRRVLDNKSLFPLQTLITLHAGQVLEESPRGIEAFYAQSWGFALFLRNAGDGKHRPALERLMADTAAGVVADPTRNNQRLGDTWRPEAMKAVLETYLGMPLGEIEKEYLQYIRQLASQVGS